MSEDLGAFKQLIKQHCGLQLEGLAEDRLRKALLAAATTAGVRQLKDFLKLLQKDEVLIKELISHLTVNETYFFRENGQIELLIKQLLPRLFKLHGQQRPLRILSAGCSSGEEPYSLVIALKETWGEAAARLFQVDAGDLDHKVLQKARKGIYSPFSFRGVPENLRLAYFQPQGSHFQLDPEVRKQVSFHELNLLAPELPKELTSYDVIFFRNVSIYFDLETRLKILQKLESLLAKDALVIVGSSETLANDLGVFQLVEEAGYYYFVKGQALLPAQGALVSPSSRIEPKTPPAPVKPRPSTPSSLEVAPASSPATDVTREPNPLPALEEVRQLLVEQETSLASRQLDRLLAQGQPASGVLLLKAWVLGNQRAFSAAENLLSELMLTHSWSLDANFMQGLLCKWQEQWQDAIACFRKVVYIQPDCWQAHFYLAEAYRQEEQWDQAFRSYKTVLRLLTSSSATSSCLQLLPLDLSRADVLFLCEHQLLRLKKNLATGLPGRS